jgi:murein DD-endopeptidase MepM/ murein hydrolase activator NlpD
MTRRIHGAACAACLTVLAGCEIERGGDAASPAGQQVDTVVRVDTVLRVDTVRVPDPIVGLNVDEGVVGEAVANARAATPAATPPAAAGAAPRAALRSFAALPAGGELPRPLLVPVAGVSAASLPDTFNEARGDRAHEALDIQAPRGTPVVAAAAGRVLKLFTSKAGGLTVYTVDPSGRWVLYYAHLDRYADGLREGATVTRGQTLGTVGSTGNASPETPHLHFAITRNDDLKRWWAGTPVDPRPLFFASTR